MDSTTRTVGNFRNRRAHGCRSSHGATEDTHRAVRQSYRVSAFSFLAEAMAAPLQAVFDKAGGISAVRNRSSGKSYPPNLGLRVDFGRLNGRTAAGCYGVEVRALPNYGFSVVREQCSVSGEGGARWWFDRVGTRFTSNVNGMKPSLDAASLSLPLVGGEAKFAPVLRTLAAMRAHAIEPGKLSQMQEPDSCTSLKPDGSNVTSVLKEIERQSDLDFRRISEIPRDHRAEHDTSYRRRWRGPGGVAARGVATPCSACQRGGSPQLGVRDLV